MDIILEEYNAWLDSVEQKIGLAKSLTTLIRGCQGIGSIVAHYFSFFVLGKAANIEIFKDFTRAKKWKRTSQYEYLFLNNPLGRKSPICNTSLSGCQNISEGFALLSSEI